MWNDSNIDQAIQMMMYWAQSYNILLIKQQYVQLVLDDLIGQDMSLRVKEYYENQTKKRLI